MLVSAKQSVINSYVVVADLDGDGDLDLISASFGDGRIVWYENIDGAGTFTGGVDIDTLGSALSVVAADLSGDGNLDLVVRYYICVLYDSSSVKQLT